MCMMCVCMCVFGLVVVVFYSSMSIARIAQGNGCFLGVGRLWNIELC